MADAFKLEGAADLRAALKGLEAQFLEAMGEQIEEEAHIIMAAGVATAPRLTGNLASGTAVKIQKRRESVQAAAGFTASRAAAVHEGVHWGHHVRDTRGFHWYGNAAVDWEPAAAKRIIQRLSALTGEGGGSAPAGKGRKRLPTAPSPPVAKKKKSGRSLKGRKKTRKLAGRKLSNKRRR